MRRAQTTMFIILGLAVLMLVGIVLYITAQDALLQPVVIPSEVRPVYDFVKSCMEETSKDALLIMGIQGGYIEIPKKIVQDPSSYIFQDAGKFLKTPLWYQEGEDRAPSFDDTNPEIQNELARTVEKDLGLCLNNFTGLETFGVTAKGEPKVKVSLTEVNVLIALDYPLTLDLLQGTPSLNTFETTLPVKLKSILTTARSLHKSENENEQLEKVVMGFIGSNADTPLGGLDFSCKEKSWRMKDVETSVKSMLELFLPKVRVKNTEYEPFREPMAKYAFVDKRSLETVADDIRTGRLPKDAPSDVYEYTHMFLDMGLQSSQPVSVDVQYVPAWGVDFLVTPNRDGLLKSQKKGGIPGLNAACVNVYQFSYTVRAPVMITVRDKEAFNGEGYAFSFATPILIAHNEGNRDPNPWKDFRPSSDDSSFCEESGGNIVTIRGLGVEEGFPIATSLTGVNVSYECAGRTCDLGKTGSSGSGSYELTTTLPPGCSPPTITLEKEGYSPTTVQLTPDQRLVESSMKKLREFKIKIMKQAFRSEKSAELQWGSVEELSSSNNVTISFTRGDDVQYLSYPADTTVKLLDGNAEYSIDAFLTTFGTLRGGFINPTWTIKQKELEGKDTIVLTLVEYYPTTDQEALSSFLYEGTYLDKLSPTLEDS